MQVILTKDVSDLGGKGEIVDVSKGFARNFLLPKKLAVLATDGALAQADEMRRAAEEAERIAKAAAEVIAQTLVGQRIVVAARSGDEGKLYGSIAPHDVAFAIEKFTGVTVDQHDIIIETPIKEIGLHEVGIRPHSAVEFRVTLDVIPA
ncbi:MAG: 50S ribosomal protein L9 [Acidobacteria bacterium]|nr:50S ribosomal protein L9 [Acidobacteriota bacterium]MCH8985556.1 50S ribosomal protein L9 [Acidobacteriota bacterium]